MANYSEFNMDDGSHFQIAASIWNSAIGREFRISSEFVSYNLRPLPNVSRAGQIAWVNHQPVGFIVVESCSGFPAPGQGWVSAIAIRPDFQKMGIGSELILWGEEWLALQKVSSIHVGASLSPFTPFLPEIVETEGFFVKRGFYRRNTSPIVWDVSRDLSGYELHPNTMRLSVDISPMRVREEDELIAFLEREFPGRWLYEYQNFHAGGGRSSDILLLRTPTGVEGFCWLTFEDSARPLDRYYHDQLPRPWGQLGPVGVRKSVRGKGYGGAIIDRGVEYLAKRGVRGAVIDWTTLVDLYGKFGFRPYRSYVVLTKELK